MVADGNRLAFAAPRAATIPAGRRRADAVATAAGRVAALGAGRVRARLSRRRRTAHRRARRPAPRVVPGVERVTAVDWQPCVAGVTFELRVGRAAALQCRALTATTQVDEPIDLPAAALQRPAARPLSLVVVKRPTTARSPACATRRRPGFTGQDSDDLPRHQRRRRVRADPVTIFVVRAGRAPRRSRSAPPVPAARRS